MKEEILKVSKGFFEAMENRDEKGMRTYAHEDCTFVHIGITCGLEREIQFYVEGTFQPTELKINTQDVHEFGDTAVVITDCNYGLLLEGKPTTHHFAVTEVYKQFDGVWKLISFTFTALVY